MLDRLFSRFRAACVLVAFLAFSPATRSLFAETHLPRLRRPVALQLSADEPLLYTATQLCGSISVLDVAARKATRKFNPPSLRGVSHRSPLLHDNRTDTLEDVFLEVGHPLEEDLLKDQLDDLLAFLRCL